jgi:hypothetical protein
MFQKNEAVNINNKLNNFGVIGYGSPQAIKTIVEQINSLNLKNKYTFWNIGPNTFGLKDIENIKFPVENGFLSRDDINKYSRKLDFTLILYDKSSYTLSCSASPMESILYSKPIIYLDNSCINEFNKHNIGIMCKSVKELTEKVADIINHPQNYKAEYGKYKKNISMLRDKLDLDNRKNIA